MAEGTSDSDEVKLEIGNQKKAICTNMGWGHASLEIGR